MSIIRVTKEFAFEAAHALYGHDGLCANIHGHSYKLYVTVIGRPIDDQSSPKNGMVIDFSVLKSIVNEKIIYPLDHSLMVQSLSPQVDIDRLLENAGVGMKIVKCEFPTTCEMMLVDFAAKIMAELPQGVRLHSLKLYETSGSFAQWYMDDNL